MDFMKNIINRIGQLEDMGGQASLANGPGRGGDRIKFECTIERGGSVVRMKHEE